MAERLLAPPTIEPVGLAEMQLHARGGDNDPVVLQAAISAAREMAEQHLGRSIVQTGWEVALDVFPDAIQLARAPVQNVLAVRYYNEAGDLVTLSPSGYQVDDWREPAWVVPAMNAAWPSTLGNFNAVRLQYLAGYVSPVTIDVAANTITLAGGRTVADGGAVHFSAQDRTAAVVPVNLVLGVTYYARDVVGSTFKLAATQGGAEVDLQAPTGSLGQLFLGTVPEAVRQWIKLQAAALYENREGEVLQGTPVQLGFVDRLLDREKVWRL